MHAYAASRWICQLAWCRGHVQAVTCTMAAATDPLPKPAIVEGALSSAWESIQDEAVKILQALIRIDTQNYGDDGGNETEAALYLKGLFDAEDIECSQVRSLGLACSETVDLCACVLLFMCEASR